MKLTQANSGAKFPPETTVMTYSYSSQGTSNSITVNDKSGGFKEHDSLNTSIISLLYPPLAARAIVSSNRSGKQQPSYSIHSHYRRVQQATSQNPALFNSADKLKELRDTCTSRAPIRKEVIPFRFRQVYS